MRILVVEDERLLCDGIAEDLRLEKYTVDCCYDGPAACERLFVEPYDLVVLDLNLPGMDGLELLRHIRTEQPELRVLILSARSQLSDKVAGLDLGADDYLQKPFGTIELLARIRTALRHTRTALEDDSIALKGSYEVGDLLIDYRKCRVYLAGKDVGLTPNEFRIVALLGKHAGQVITYRAMLKELWGPYASRDNKILRVHMANIRRKIEPNPDEPRYIFTEVGIGYRMSEE